MEGFVVSARKYRPVSFEEVVGQSHVTHTLKNAIQMDQLAHAFLFSGPRGVGKTTCARILAKAINCQDPPEKGEACGKCDSCRAFDEGRSLNIHELDAASNNGVEDIRKIIDQVRYVPTTGKKSVFIIDEVHMLSTAAFNAFLKTLEEPPPHAIFILATTEKHKILPTILSRVQKFDFRRIKVDDIAEHLKAICEKENITYEFEALQLIGIKSDGALRDALSIFDQIVSFSNRNVTYNIVVDNLNVLDHDYFFRAVDMINAQDHEGLLLMLNEIIERGFEPRSFLTGLTEHFRNLIIIRTPKTEMLLETSDNIRKRYQEQVASVSPSHMLNAFNLCSESEQGLKGATNPRMHVELALLKLAFLNQAVSLAAEIIEKKKPELSGTKNEFISGSGQSLTAKVEPTENQVPIVPGTKKAKTTVLSGKFKLPKSLDEIDLNLKKNEVSEENTEEEFVKYDPSVNVSKEKFEAAYDLLVKNFEEEKKYRISSTLRKDMYELDHNKWIQKVPDIVAKKQLNEEKDLIQFMRDQTGISNLILEIEVVENAPQQKDRIPYTNEEKLKKMIEINPELENLIKKLDAMLKY